MINVEFITIHWCLYTLIYLLGNERLVYQLIKAFIQDLSYCKLIPYLFNKYSDISPWIVQIMVSIFFGYDHLSSISDIPMCLLYELIFYFIIYPLSTKSMWYSSIFHISMILFTYLTYSIYSNVFSYLRI